MVSIGCVQGQAEGHREPLFLVPTSEGIPQDVMESFGVQESQEDLQGLHLAPDWEQSTPLFSGEMREFLSKIRTLTSKITQVCQDICDKKLR